MTALSVYLTNAASTVLTTANKLYIASGTPTNSTHDQVIGTATGFGELTARSNAAWLAGGSIGAPTGRGWFLDLTTLDAQRITAGNWSSIIKLQAQQGGGQAGTLTADLYVRAYKYSSGVYTQIVSMLLSAQTIAVGADFTLPNTSASAMTFATGDKLYIDIWANVTVNANGASNQAIRVQKLSTDTGGLTGATDSVIVTPGYASSLSTNALTTYLANQQSAINANADQLYTLAGAPTLTTRDVVVGTSTGYGEITSHGVSAGGNDSPYGAVYYFSGQTVPVFPDKLIDLLVGGSRAGVAETGLIPGGPIWVRMQPRWLQQERVKTNPPTYDATGLTTLDDAISRCNAANILICMSVQSPPTWRLTIDINGNPTPYDGQSYIGTLTNPINTTGVNMPSITVSALGTSDTLSDGQQITIDTNGTNPENVLVSGNYASGAKVISVLNTAGNPWKPASTHAAGVKVQNTGAQFVSPTDAGNYFKFFAARYNGTTVNAITGAAQTALTVQVLQWNEDYDTPGNNTQRDRESQWFVTSWQTVGPLIRQYHPTCKLGSAACRRTSPNGLNHIQTWFDHIFSYKPPGSSVTGCYQWLDFLDYHYYRSSVNPPDPAIPVPNPSGSNVPTHAQELLAIKAVAANYGFSNFDVWCTETGFDMFDDGTGQTYQSLQQCADFFCGPGNSGNLTGNDGIFEQHRKNGGSHVFVWTINPNAVEKAYLNPPQSIESKSIVQKVQNTNGGALTFTKLTPYTAMQTYMVANPQWGNTGSNWAGGGSIGSPTGKGWFLDGNLLDNQQLVAGTYTATLNFKAVVNGGPSGTLVAGLYVRISRFSSGVYTTIATLSLTGQTVNSTGAAYSPTTGGGTLKTFSPGDRLYIDIWANITTNANGNANQAIRLQKLSTDITNFTGDPGAQIVTPGYQAQSGTIVNLINFINELLTGSESVTITSGFINSSGQMTQADMKQQYDRIMSSVVGPQLAILANVFYGNSTNTQVIYGELDALFPFEDIGKLHVMKSVNDVTNFIKAYEFVSTVLSDIPVVAYPLNETSGIYAYDVSGRGMTGVYSNTAGTLAGVTQGQPGALTASPDTGVLLDGSQGLITLPPAVNTANWGALTASAWINPSNITFTQTAWIMGNDDPASSNVGFALAVKKNAVVLRIGTGSTYYEINQAFTFVASTVYRLAGIFDGSSLKTYLNGSQIATTAIPPVVWYNTSYVYRKQIVIDHTQVVGGVDHASFPMRFSRTDTDLKTAGNGGKIQNSNGFDIIFVDSTNSTKLDHEIEKYVASTGEIEMHVRIPTLSHTVDTTIYMYFDNSSISTSQENKTGVWDANFKGVYHLGNGTTLSVADSTSNANNGTNNGATATTGKIDGGASTNGTSTYISLPTAGFPTGAGAFTLECWIQISSQLGSNFEEPFAFGTRASNQGFSFWFNNDNTLHAGFINGGDIAGPVPTLNTPHKLVATYNGTTLIFYYDGASQGSTTTTGGIVLTRATLGVDIDLAHEWFPGVTDEARISNTARSAGWVGTEYNNQSSPLTFYSAGSLTSQSSGNALIAQTTNQILIGAKPGSTANNFPGAVQAANLFNTALSAAQELALYTAGNNPT